MTAGRTKAICSARHARRVREKCKFRLIGLTEVKPCHVAVTGRMKDGPRDVEAEERRAEEAQQNGDIIVAG